MTIDRARVYNDMLGHLQAGWAQGQYDTGNRVCLVGALQRALNAQGVETSYLDPGAIESRFLKEIDQSIAQNYPRSRSRGFMGFISPHARVTMWNDSSSRKRRHILKVVRELAKDAEYEWEAQVQESLEDMRARIELIEQKIAELRAKNADRETLAALDRELDTLINP